MTESVRTPLSPTEMSRLREKREKYKKNKVDPLVPLDALLERVLEKNVDKALVAQTAKWMVDHDEFSVQIQIKLRALALSERAKSFNHKIMLLYVLHEFLKIDAPTAAARKARHVEWTATVEQILHACVRESYRDMKPIDDNRKKLLKTLGRWEELGIYRGKLKEWKKVVVGELKVRKAPQRILSDTVQPFDKEGLDLRRELDRGNIAWFYEPTDFRSPRAKMRHWRFTGVAFIDTLGRCLGLDAQIVMTAMSFFQKLYKKGFYAKERYKFAAAALFLSAKASSQRMKLLRMVHVMHYILETPLVTGDEEKEELERLHLLHYELQVLKGIDFELTIEMPFDAFKRAGDAYSPAVEDAAKVVLKDLYWTKMCIEFPPSRLAQAAWYIASTETHRRIPTTVDKDVEHDCDLIRDYYSECKDWKTLQRTEFDKRTESDDDLMRYLEAQRGGLTLHDIVNPREQTHLKPEELERMGEVRLESDSGPRSTATSDKAGERSDRGSRAASRDRGDDRRASHHPRDNTTDRDRSRERRGGGDRGREKDRSRDRPRSRDRYRSSPPRERSRDRGRERSRDRRDRSRDRRDDRREDRSRSGDRYERRSSSRKDRSEWKRKRSASRSSSREHHHHHHHQPRRPTSTTHKNKAGRSSLDKASKPVVRRRDSDSERKEKR
ncbi:Aste57867_14783 [Aphanomyces stellatus]|uniref:Aste57867_14783 protein n=1 Tax=Aphanomyces stellatus TaxID=120398 RepID=A0A485L1L8_9STRA|nr:hypothetical protein As57867_014728 [Aphanomyces stellatus]VFT91601.1 Aste57867_14783 [Aphanomyces stellatus]